MKLKNILLLLGVAALSSCVMDDQDLKDGLVPVSFSVADDEGAFTRATSSVMTFTSGEKVKVYVKPNGTTSYTGYDYTVASTSSSPALTAPSTPPYFPAGNSTTVQAYAYYPSTAGTTFSVSTTQTNDANYKASDLMYCTDKTITKGNASSATLTMAHKMAQLKIVASAASGSGLTLKSVKVNAKYQVSFTASSGATSVTGSATDITGWTGSTTSSNTCYILIPPQAVNGITVKIATGNSTAGETATYSFANTESLLAGYSYTMNLTVGKQDVGVTTSISNWTPSGNLSVNPVQSVLNLNTLTSAKTIDQNMILTGTTSQNITIADNVLVVLKGATINTRLRCSGNATIILNGTNSVPKGITPGPTNKTLTIDGDGSLSILGINSSDANEYGWCNAGIGSEQGTSCGNITINSGEIHTKAGRGGAGIGGTDSYPCGDITISGGRITSQGGFWGAGIGGGCSAGDCNNIIISGGIINALGGGQAAGIGCGSDCSYSSITISGGTITATGAYDSSDNYGAAGIGGGNAYSGGNITITAGITKIVATKNSHFSGGNIDFLGNGMSDNGTKKISIDGSLYDSGEGGSSRTIMPANYRRTNLASAKVGMVVCSDGYAYEPNSAIPDGVSRIAMVAYVGNKNGTSGTSAYSSTYNHGLAIALDNTSASTVTYSGANEAANYNGSAKSYEYAVHAPSNSSGWFLPSFFQWERMFLACNESSDWSEADFLSSIPDDEEHFIGTEGFDDKIKKCGGSWEYKSGVSPYMWSSSSGYNSYFKETVFWCIHTGGLFTWYQSSESGAKCFVRSVFAY